ncbi:MAG: tRNA pseudouridine(55) synthase TruB [Clostridiales Family XIII bacterium]|jgi:tRNA pseudouridine55 synthase|nr:tRNA pseudouridine(55) synthase TruB [Clostridiales Family XIII bacterium]
MRIEGILPVAKPQAMTSHDVVAILRRLTGVKRIGHSGTLDPMATGVLPIYIGKATRVIEYASAPGDPAAKAYRCRMRLGLETDTQDVWGAQVAAYEGPLPDEAAVRGALLSFEGEILQTPPMYSAVKVGGRKLYELARKGEAAAAGAVKSRKVYINNITVIEYDAEAGEALFDVVCGKGVYVRTICADAGRLLGCGAAMSGLERTKSDGFLLADCVPLEALREAGGVDAALLRPIDAPLSWMPRVDLAGADAARFCNGLPCEAGGEGTVRAYEGGSGRFLGIATAGGGALRPEKVFYSEGAEAK